jgi:hypothetical protein
MRSKYDIGVVLRWRDIRSHVGVWHAIVLWVDRWWAWQLYYAEQAYQADRNKPRPR